MRASGPSTRGGFGLSASVGRRLRLPAQPWHVILLAGEAVFAMLKWIVPAMCSSSLVLQPLAAFFSGMALEFSAIAVVAGLVVSQQRRLRHG